MTPRYIAVIDIGKTNAKLVLVDATDLSELEVLTRPNTVLAAPPYPHFDVDTIWRFILDGLERFQKAHGVDAISIATHGAACALIAPDGTLAAPILDYEHAGPDDMAEAYDAIRPKFSETGSPKLSLGLNLGAPGLGAIGARLAPARALSSNPSGMSGRSPKIAQGIVRSLSRPAGAAEKRMKLMPGTEPHRS